MRISQRQLNLWLLFVLTLLSTVQMLSFFLRQFESFYVIGYGVGAGISAAMFFLYWRGWDPARYVMVVAITLIIAFSVNEPYLTVEIATELFLAPTIALLLAGPAWVIGSGVGMLLIIGYRAGWVGEYVAFETLISYAMILVGMAISRVAIDQRAELEESNTALEIARRAAERQSQELTAQNEQLQRLLAENQRQQATIQQIDLPILPIGERALVMPLVGELDPLRVEQAQAKLLKRVHEHACQHVLIDLSTVTQIDHASARGLSQLITATRLLGAEVLLVGLQASVATTITQEQIDLGGVLIFRDAQDALTQVIKQPRLFNREHRA
ncbi:MAG: STAS domain-containing protein [Roseiflexaceae bacterium]